MHLAIDEKCNFGKGGFQILFGRLCMYPPIYGGGGDSANMTLEKLHLLGQ